MVVGGQVGQDLKEEGARGGEEDEDLGYGLEEAKGSFEACLGVC
jgi:hypothetical protein